MKRLLILLSLAGALAGQTPPRERALQEQLVAACCWNESIAVHRSETAAEMRAELKAMIEQGLTDQQILDRFKAKYSARVLIEPKGGASVLIYTVPAAALLLGGIGLIFLIRRWARSQQLSPNH